MYLPSCHIDLSDMKINLECHQVIHSIVRSLRSLTPSDSYLNLVVSKNASSFEGSMTVVSHQDRFEASFSGSSPVNVVKLLNTDMLRQLEDWVKTRVL